MGRTYALAVLHLHPEPEVAELIRTGRLEEFAAMDWDTSAVPDPQDPATFSAQAQLGRAGQRAVRCSTSIDG